MLERVHHDRRVEARVVERKRVRVRDDIGVPEDRVSTSTTWSNLRCVPPALKIEHHPFASRIIDSASSGSSLLMWSGAEPRPGISGARQGRPSTIGQESLHRLLASAVRPRNRSSFCPDWSGSAGSAAWRPTGCALPGSLDLGYGRGPRRMAIVKRRPTDVAGPRKCRTDGEVLAHGRFGFQHRA